MDGGPHLLIGVVVAVGVLYTIVPDTGCLTRCSHGSKAGRGGRLMAARARFGPVVSTLLIGFAVWLVGAALRSDLARWSTSWRAFALVAFGDGIALTADIRRAMRRPSSSWGNGHAHSHPAAAHHRHRRGTRAGSRGGADVHIHLHRAGRAHRMGHGRRRRLPPSHERSHQSRRGTRPVLIVGSSPIVEDILAFFVAGE